MQPTSKPGLVHLYCGDGKGKTTAAMGLALRALGAGHSVTILQFLKDGSSAELAPLRTLGARVLAGQTGSRFVFQMTEAERAQTRQYQSELLRTVLADPCDLLILDEACAVWQLDMVDRDLLQKAVLGRPAGREVVLTGINLSAYGQEFGWMREAADYCTEMCARRHPYDRGVPARPGIEY